MSKSWQEESDLENMAAEKEGASEISMDFSMDSVVKQMGLITKGIYGINPYQSDEKIW